MHPIQTVSRMAIWGTLLALLSSCNSLLDWKDARACGNGVLGSGEECDDSNTADGDGCSSTCLIEYTPSKKVDLLFVVDFSLSMTTVRAEFQNRLPQLLGWLKVVKGGLPDLHIGITSMDVGALGNLVSNCSESGDDGKLLKINTPNLLNQNFIVDIAPAGCVIAKAQRTGEELKCTGHNCTDANCRSPNINTIEAGDLSLTLDEQGCPRCRNYVNDSMTQIFQDLINGPQSSCGWEQPLEAMMLALTQDHPENFNFRRPDAHLVVLFLTDEDDCSAATPDLFNPGAENLGEYGPMRCIQWGLRCYEDWTLDPLHVTENYTGCRPRLEVENGKLKDVSQYVRDLNNLVSSYGYRTFVQVMALTGPHKTDLTIYWNGNYWGISPAGSMENAKVMPNLRLYDFTWRLNQQPEDMQWTFFSILDPDWELPLNMLGQRLRDVMERSMTAK